MPHDGPADRSTLVALVTTIVSGSFRSDAEADDAVADLERRVLDPQVSDYIFWPGRHLDHEPTPEEIVDRALACRPVAL